MPTKNAKRSTSFIRLLWPAAAANGTPVLALRMARTPHWAFGCKPDQKGASPSQALGGAGGLWRSLWLAGLLWSTARGSHAGRVQGLLARSWESWFGPGTVTISAALRSPSARCPDTAEMSAGARA